MSARSPLLVPFFRLCLPRAPHAASRVSFGFAPVGAGLQTGSWVTYDF